MRFFTSDHHFGHANILKYEARNRVTEWGSPFRSVNEMDEAMIDRWNAIIDPGDEVFVLGDFSFKMALNREYLPYLNGSKTLIVGNHDPFFKEAVNNQKNLQDIQSKAKDCGWHDLQMSLRLSMEGVGEVLLSHFPYKVANPNHVPKHVLRYEQLKPSRQARESLLLHGHVHGAWQSRVEQAGDRTLKMINVGVDVWGLEPVSELQILNLFHSMNQKTN